MVVAPIIRTSPAPQGRFQYVGPVQGAAFHLTGAQNGVNFVDKEHYIGIGRGFLEYGQQFFLKDPSILAPGHHGADRDFKDAKVPEARRNVTGGDQAGQSLDNGGFAHAGGPLVAGDCFFLF